MNLESGELRIADVKKILPHRHPFLLVDRVLELEKGKRVKALKNVTVNEDFFNGHFPGFPIMPGVLIVEALAQASGFIAFSTGEDPETRILLFAGIDDVRFREQVTPGDQLILESELIAVKRTLWVFAGKAYVAGKLVAEAQIKMIAMDRPR